MGERNRSSIIKGLDSGPLDYISLSLHFYKIRYEILKSQLGSIVKDNQFNYNRYFIGKRVMYKTNKLKISFGELFIYAGINRGVELKYLNPFTPSFIKDINTSDFEIGDNYNSIIFTTFNWVLNDEIEVFWRIYC